MTAQIESENIQDGRHDFDFLVGSWDIASRRLKERLKGSTEWEEFKGMSTIKKTLAGLGNFDEVTFWRESRAISAITLRLFNPANRQWSIYWVAASSPEMDTPMIGHFEDKRGLFYDHELFEGKGIFSRFIWTVKGENSCRWEQAYSPDGGETWETNWTMDFTRRAEGSIEA